jgi:hypothetical protein
VRARKPCPSVTPVFTSPRTGKDDRGFYWNSLTYETGWYDPRGFVGGADFLKDQDKAKILGLSAARLLKITGRLASMGISSTRARGT